ISEAVKRNISLSVGRVRRAEMIEVDGLGLLTINGKPLLLVDENEELYIPFIAEVGKHVSCPSIVVDMGAVSYIVNGADVMAPGIVFCEEFEEGNAVCVKTEKYEKVIAVGVALMASEKVEALKKGKAVKNHHHVGDRYWNSAKDLFQF
ncbi:MAG: hypothetical protein GTN80_07500, partial [Nitrososphaeria archaeon]|nr:hypothetical protein [Nitrososphaeria archaeon]NIQ33470.1 hypothetical protein [Nitrososphaeria archaeon]